MGAELELDCSRSTVGRGGVIGRPCEGLSMVDIWNWVACGEQHTG